MPLICVSRYGLLHKVNGSCPVEESHREVIHFISRHIIHRFDIPQTLTTDQGSSLISHQVYEFAESLKIKLLSSSSYNA
jgi:hypothetical protein